jgi:hypothetical protein
MKNPYLIGELFRQKSMRTNAAENENICEKNLGKCGAGRKLKDPTFIIAV